MVNLSAKYDIYVVKVWHRRPKSLRKPTNCCFLLSPEPYGVLVSLPSGCRGSRVRIPPVRAFSVLAASPAGWRHRVECSSLHPYLMLV